MHRDTMKKIFTAKLEKTKLGNIIFNWLMPIGVIYYGIYGIITKEITLSRFTYTDLNAQVMGLAIILLTIAICWGDDITSKLKQRYYMTILIFISLGLILYSTYNSYLLIQGSLDKQPEVKNKI